MRRRPLSEDTRSIIRELYAAGWSIARIAEKYGLAHGTVAYHADEGRRQAVLDAAKVRYARLMKGAAGRSEWVRSAKQWPKPGSPVLILFKNARHPLVGHVDVFNPAIWVVRTPSGSLIPVDEPAHWSPIPPLPKATIHGIR